MYSAGLFFIQILIILVFVILFLLVKHNKISIGSACILLVMSIAAFLFFPGTASRLGILPAVFILILFVLFGMELVIMLEEKKLSNLKLENIRSFFNFEKLLKKLDLPHRLKFADSILNFKKVEEIIENKNNKDNHVSVVEQQDRTRQEEQDVLKSFMSNESMSYVDFDNKSEQYSDVFSKFIRGEIPASEVRERISQKSIEVEEKETVEANKAVDNNNSKKRTKKAAVKKPITEGNKSESDTQSIETAGIDMSVEQYIDLAFDAKKEGRFMEAVEFYIQALEKRPEEQLILWIIIDICSLYRELGQENLAKEMILSYIETAGNSISQEVKDDLKKNFSI